MLLWLRACDSLRGWMALLGASRYGRSVGWRVLGTLFHADAGGMGGMGRWL